MKERTTLYLDSDLVRLYKARYGNLSKAVNEWLKDILNVKDKTTSDIVYQIKKAEAELAVLQRQLQQRNRYLEDLQALRVQYEKYLEGVGKDVAHYSKLMWVSSRKMDYTSLRKMDNGELLKLLEQPPREG